MLRTFLITSLLIITSCSAPAPVPTTRGYWKAVVRVMGISEGHRTGGTGFVVQTRKGAFILTNYHICHVANDLGYFIVNRNDEDVTGTSVFESKAADLCLIQIPNTRWTALALATEELSGDDAVLSYGHPRLGPIYAYVGVYKGEELLEVEKASDTVGGRKAFHVSFRVVGGQSGSPVLNTEGKVAGVVFAYDRDGTGLAIPLHTIRDVVNAFEGAP